MGIRDWLASAFAPSEKFSARWSISDPAFAAWWTGTDDSIEQVTPTTVLGLSAVLRSVQIISGTIAGLPLRTYERDDSGERQKIPSVFDDPYPGIEGMTPFAWTETVLIHLLIWREAFLWHDAFDAQGNPSVYRPISPDAFIVKRVNGKRLFEYTDAETREKKEVGSEQITYIPGPSLDGVRGHPMLSAARSIFSAAISGDKTAQTVLRRGIRLAGLLTPADDQEDFSATEGEAMLEKLRSKVVGRENAGDVAILNKRLKLQPWTPNNIESQWHETRGDVLGEIGRLFGIPPHLLNDTEKQTSWGTGVAEQNLGLAKFTLMGWSTRIEQILSRRLPAEQFVEFDYTGLLQGTPQQEIELLLKQTGNKPFLLLDEARRIRNLPPLTAKQRAELTAAPTPAPVSEPPTPIRQERSA
jgi:HK97 family phage portal protein